MPDHQTTSKRTLRGALAVAATTLLTATLVVAASPGADAKQPAPAPSAHVAKHTLTAHLKGSSEAPDPGDPNGSGSVTIKLKPGQHKVCAHATWKKIGTPTMAHIHKGKPGVSGDVVVDLASAVTGGSACETGVSKKLIRKLAAHPRQYYFNIHTAAFSAGAIRGQLH